MCEKIILILAIVLMSGCSPLRNVQPLVAKDLMSEVSVSHPTPKRIIHTKVETVLDRTTHTDSISRSRINTAARSEEQSQVDESPNTAGMLWLKWLAVSLVALLLLLLILKLKF